MSHLFLFSFLFVYDELLLRMFNGKGIFSHLIYPVIFGIAAILFITETLVKRTFQVYMTLPSILSGAGGVAGNYTSQMISTIFGGLFVIVLFFLPLLVYLLFGKKLFPSYQYKWPASILNVVLSLSVFVVGVLFSSVGSSRVPYLTQYEFNNGQKHLYC